MPPSVFFWGLLTPFETVEVVIGLRDSTATVKELAEFAKQEGLTYPPAIGKKAGRRSSWFSRH